MTKVLVIAEQHKGILATSTYSTLSAALKLAPKAEILLATDHAAPATELAQLKGVDCVWIMQHPRFAHIIAEDLSSLIVSVAKTYTHILAPATTFGKNVMPRVAALLDVAQISDVTQIEAENMFVRPIYAGNILETLRTQDPIKVLTIRTTAFDATTAIQPTSAPIKPLTCAFQPFEKTQFLSEQTPKFKRPPLTTAKSVVSGGRGLKSAENFKMIEQLADKLGAAIGASRAAVDAGWISNDLQVGQTGKVVAPDLYIAIGISGAIQHLAGMKDSKIIVAINKDADAPIFQVADYGLVGDLFQVIPALLSALK